MSDINQEELQDIASGKAEWGLDYGNNAVRKIARELLIARSRIAVLEHEAAENARRFKNVQDAHQAAWDRMAPLEARASRTELAEKALKIAAGENPVAIVERELGEGTPRRLVVQELQPGALDTGLAVYRKAPVQTRVVTDERAAFNLFMATDYSPDRSGATSGEDENVFNAVLWHIWVARSKLGATAEGDS